MKERSFTLIRKEAGRWSSLGNGTRSVPPSHIENVGCGLMWMGLDEASLSKEVPRRNFETGAPLSASYASGYKRSFSVLKRVETEIRSTIWKKKS
ncbi:hypothetical protein TNCV_1000001 [Trichonephila clavipes]|nr:hypothetical protein TNCV_1000001 [Trichonephila clavipes]